MGVLYFKPSVALKDVGRDSNVFFSRDDEQSDITATVSPAAEGALRFGSRGFLTIKLGGAYVWYRRFHTLNHTNLTSGLKGNLNLRDLRFFAAADYLRHEERPSSELDQRARRTNVIQRVGAGYEYSPMTALDIIVKKERITYRDPDFVFQQCPVGCPTYTLTDFLSRTETTGNLRFTQKVMGRTRLVLDVQKRRYDFTTALPDRDASGERPVVGSMRDSGETRLLAGVELEPGAVLSGSLRAGTVDFRPKNVSDQRTRRGVWNAALNWRLGNRLALATVLDRGLQFSTFGGNLYYREDRRGAECVYHLNRLLGVEAGYDGYRLLYPTITQAPGFSGRRRDRIRILKGGLRFKLANRTTATLRVADRRRSSNIPDSEDRQVFVTTGVETTF